MKKVISVLQMRKWRLKVVSCSRSQKRDQGGAVCTGTLPHLVSFSCCLWHPWRSAALGVLVSPRSDYCGFLGLQGCFLFLACCSWPVYLENSYGAIKSQLSRSLHKASLTTGDRSVTREHFPSMWTSFKSTLNDPRHRASWEHGRASWSMHTSLELNLEDIFKSTWNIGVSQP